ncbi:hypothetical protein O181_040727 [Austropuccinia psidii MF-1]|uniref:Uncharacterized protein n=1 Tax=Austropuccinia psidii MF-1 TaxID=1389203 RepID=A0A9Q3HE64_9BASI|nr:hypothetical protein [Austropuccinia psidii MF-1]
MQDALVRTPLWSTMLKAFPRRNGLPNPKLADEQNPPNPLQQDTSVPCMPCEQTPQEPTSGLSGTQWSENSFCEPSQDNEPPIPGSSPSPEAHGDLSPFKPEPEVALTHSLEEPLPEPLRYDHISKKVTEKFL